jgi:hypothetical protein
MRSNTRLLRERGGVPVRGRWKHITDTGHVPAARYDEQDDRTLKCRPLTTFVTLRELQYMGIVELLLGVGT